MGTGSEKKRNEYDEKSLSEKVMAYWWYRPYDRFKELLL